MKEKDESAVQLGIRIAQLRIARGFSQEKMAEICDMNRTYYGCIERGEKAATIITIDKIAKGFGITKSELFDY